jgi:hypothetical protein
MVSMTISGFDVALRADYLVQKHGLWQHGGL